MLVYWPPCVEYWCFHTKFVATFLYFHISLSVSKWVFPGHWSPIIPSSWLAHIIQTPYWTHDGFLKEKSEGLIWHCFATQSVILRTVKGNMTKLFEANFDIKTEHIVIFKVFVFLNVLIWQKLMTHKELHLERLFIDISPSGIFAI